MITFVVEPPVDDRARDTASVTVKLVRLVAVAVAAFALPATLTAKVAEATVSNVTAPKSPAVPASVLSSVKVTVTPVPKSLIVGDTAAAEAESTVIAVVEASIFVPLKKVEAPKEALNVSTPVIVGVAPTLEKVAVNVSVPSAPFKTS